MEREDEGYQDRTDNRHKSRGMKNPLRLRGLIPHGWRERCGGVVRLRALIIGDIDKARTKKGLS